MRSKVWLYPGFAGWHFVSLPKKESREIRTRFSAIKRGWGSLPVIVTVGKTQWRTSIFPDNKTDTYVLALKADVRKKENISMGGTISYTIEIQGI